MQCIAKACPNPENVILSLCLHVVFSLHFQNTYRNSRVVYTVFTTSDIESLALGERGGGLLQRVMTGCAGRTVENPLIHINVKPENHTYSSLESRTSCTLSWWEGFKTKTRAALPNRVSGEWRRTKRRLTPLTN